MLKIKDKDFLEYQFDKRKEYKELLDFIKDSDKLSITIKKSYVGIEDIIILGKRTKKISTSTAEKILEGLIEQEDKCIDTYLNLQLNSEKKADLVEKVGEIE